MQHHLCYKTSLTCQICVVRRFDKVVGKRKVHIVVEVKQIRGNYLILLRQEVAEKAFKAELMALKSKFRRDAVILY